MIKGYVFNPLSGNLDVVGKIPELSADPVSPSAEDAWVRRNGSGGVSIPDGTPIGLLLALTYTGNVGVSFTYEFRYRTNSGNTVGVALN